MAGPNKATWVKVVGKGGRITTRAIGMTQGGDAFTQGQTITQAEFNEVRKQAAKSDKKTSADKDKESAKPKSGVYVVPAESPPKKVEDPMKQDEGTALYLYQDEVYSLSSVEVSKSKVDKMAKAYQSKGDPYLPSTALAIQDKKGAFEIVSGHDVYLANKRANTGRVRVVIANENARPYGKIEQMKDRKLVTAKAEKPPSNYSGNMPQDRNLLLNLYSDEVYLGKSAKVSNKRIAEYEKVIKADPENRNWAPVYVKQNRAGFEVVGNQEVYLAAKRAGNSKIWTVIVGDGDEGIF
jgi:hypothetical protein